MKFIQGTNRYQTHLFPVSLEESIDIDNEVRLIDLFVDSLSLKMYGFDMSFDENGRPAYHLRRIMNIVGHEVLKRYLKMLFLTFFRIDAFLKHKYLNFEQGNKTFNYSKSGFTSSLNRFIFDLNLE